VKTLLALAWLAGAMSCGDANSDLIEPVAVVRRGCQSQVDCSLATPICDVPSGDCVECLTNADCPSAERHLCDPDTHGCAECTTDGDCHSPTEVEVCSKFLGSCAVRCATVMDCPVATDPYCNTKIGFCVECQTDADCQGTTQPLCRNFLCAK
jgi:hypothetical protein